MSKIVSHFLIVFLLLSFFGFAQAPKKVLNTKFTNEKIVIDGKFDEESWKTASIAKDFVMINPDNAKPEPHGKRSEIKIVYDNEAIYVAATLYDDEPSKILREIATRDDNGTADQFGIFLNGFNDGQQEFRFFVTASGVQQDCLYTNSNDQDFSWDAVWDSKVRITDIGWLVELKIPYAALRFSPEKKQTWGLNFFRDVRSARQLYAWNLLDSKIQTEANQAGLLEGIENIETPTRLFLIPYSSFYLNGNKTTKTKGELKGGLDIKYGINDAFTLDAILVPDFGQTTFDNVELNLGPFEQQFNENRPFFTEGTELFSKGGLFYSRRIGGSPSTYATLNTNEEFIKNPSKVNLLNALKISGRTKNGLGIGILNAVTDKTFAEIRNTVTGEERKELIEPLANYNVFVLDQRFRKNSSFSIINTNVTRNAEFRDANVTAALFDLNTKKNTFNLSGDYKYSYVNQYQDVSKKGYNSTLNFSDTNGKFRYYLNGEYVSKNFDKDDLGIQFQTHYHGVYTGANYRILKPTKYLNQFSSYYNSYAEFDNRTGRIQGMNLNLNFNFTSKKNDYYNFGFNGRPFDTYDFYEPRSENEMRFLKIPKNLGMFLNFSSNYNRKFAVDISPSFAFVNEKDRINYNFKIVPRYRFSDKFSLVYALNFQRQNKNVGYIDTDSSTGEIIMARRNRITYINTLLGKYSLNNVMNINLSIRYYWSYSVNQTYLTLQEDGSVTQNSTYAFDTNRNLNSWNLDLSYSWRFAPGSQVSILYRNNSFVNDRYLDANFNTEIESNFKNTLNHENLSHAFSVSIRYFIDYNSLKH